ncbi:MULTISPECIES: hypothetical protein [unclassified Polaromonas]|jgi:hypothetical protein|uniref:hypothetical protein n=1 Tax=unclassified Polaromonas TaxID=2638319 RepID=UPI000BCF821E|nr:MULTISPECIES: hypothetical protein [unclassified Polaromonas]OYY34779.1 MAG: hypothetical protein B7Y60_15180 [Polaromonas sp. 35-63-35]OYZ19334.1 MAG: hypothetical protein B7Y28_12410 [Polaromonas sp. 16-63-31]OYZ77540.1 MAG: hypothetical protein B7Y09_16340 [Polaromonas sp. 24-63-21]OZA48477.1 MAG: hypothetical protein B7X88_18180 [Polaromonas sp. 17-63-33]OZA87225.1 MAG: hypothetical protein B7X65_13650 [Polaromonas sp. 39-63-25]
MTEQQTASMGVNARQVLDNAAYQAAMTSLKAQVVQQWKDCPVRDKEGQLLLLQLAKLADKFDGILSGMIEAGKFAEHKIDLDAERDESRGRRMLRRAWG